jgi:hypothetical protein
MAEVYAQNVDRLNDAIQAYKQGQVEDYDEASASLASKFAEAQSEYKDKWDAVKGGGEDALLGQMGVHGLISGGKKAMALYKKYKNRGKPATKDEADKDPEQESGKDGNLGDADGEAGSGDVGGTNDGGLADLGYTEEDASTFFDDPPKTGTAVDSITGATSESTPQAPKPSSDGVDTGAEAPQAPAVSQPPVQGETGTMTHTTQAEEATDVNEDPFSAPRSLGQEQTIRTGAEAPESGLVGGEEGEGLLSRVGSGMFENLAQKGRAIKSGFQSVKGFFSQSGSGTDSAGSAGGAGADAGASAEVGAESGVAGADAGVEGALTAGDAVLGAIPVVGEIGLFVGGLVALGEGLYHLFHPDKAPKPPPKPTLQIPHQLASKMTSALPSFDASADSSGSMSSF